MVPLIHPKQGFDYPQLPGRLNPRYYQKTDILSISDIIYTEFMVKAFIADLGISRTITRTPDIFQVQIILLVPAYLISDFQRHFFFLYKLQGFLRE